MCERMERGRYIYIYIERYTRLWVDKSNKWTQTLRVILPASLLLGFPARRSPPLYMCLHSINYWIWGICSPLLLFLFLYMLLAKVTVYVCMFGMLWTPAANINNNPLMGVSELGSRQIGKTERDRERESVESRNSCRSTVKECNIHFKHTQYFGCR